ncbi:MAG: PLP-dependent aminotransferase family protein, partial [Deltaproteobacteria bacterium]|nr:PLP-dependent aminotransferase family protein [Deltaproteobacteria bacterium]
MDPRVVELHRRAAARGDVIPLAGGLPAEELLPRAALAAVIAEAARDPDALQYGWPEGHEVVRAWIARRLRERGMQVDADDVIVTAGAQQALALAAPELAHGAISAGAATYPAALDAFAAADVAVTCDARAAAHYVIPGASNPSGVDLVEPVRAELLASACVIADEAYVELRFDGRVPPPLAAAAPDRVWHVGTVSKT